METKGFYINFCGDPTVGIQHAEWKLEGDFYFECKEDYTTFRQKLIEAFEYCSDVPISIITFEEREDQIKKEII